jgi:PHP family Zn ribbon phosphoesterase
VSWYGDRCECGGVFDRMKVFRFNNMEQFVCACSACGKLIVKGEGLSSRVMRVAEESFKKP